MLDLPVVKWMPEENIYKITWCGIESIRDTAQEVKELIAYIFCDEEEPCVNITFAENFFGAYLGPRDEL